MIVTPDAVARRLDQGLSPELLGDEHLRTLAHEFAREILDYGVSVLPRDVFRGRSGAEIAAMVTEGLETVRWASPLLRPREVRVPAPEPTTDDEAEAEPTAPKIERVPPRVVEVSSGWSITSILLAKLHPELEVELVEGDLKRMWWWHRLRNLHGLRNLTVHQVDPQAFARANRGRVDVVLVHRMAPSEALDFGVPLVREGGRVLSLQRSDRSAEVRRPRTNDDGVPVRFEVCHAFESPAAKGRCLLCVGVGVTALDAQGTAA